MANSPKAALLPAPIHAAGSAPVVAAASGPSKARVSKTGTLTIWVPAGIVGDSYWIYLDGRIVRSPRPGAADPRIRGSTVLIQLGGDVQRHDGWELITTNGLNLRMRHEQWDRPVDTSIRSDDPVPRPIFIPLKVERPPGEYVVEVAFLSPTFEGEHSALPFVISRPYRGVVRVAQAQGAVVAVPDAWEPAPRLPRPRFSPCAGPPAPADPSSIAANLKRYSEDPMVTALRGAVSAGTGSGGRTVKLKLPLEYGSTREFDGEQLRQIIYAIEEFANFPSAAALSECQGRVPAFASSYAAYGKLLATTVTAEMTSFRTMADRLALAR
jgi:hypothetical protein